MNKLAKKLTDKEIMKLRKRLPKLPNCKVKIGDKNVQKFSKGR